MISPVAVCAPLTHYVEAAVELADPVSGPALAHLADLGPLVEVRVEALHAGQRLGAVVASHCIDVALAGRGRGKL